MRVQLEVLKRPKFGRTESGDTVEVIERRRGGLSVILADGQGSGPAAKEISNLVVGKAVSLITDGARDGAVARTVNDYLFATRGGKVSSTLSILSVDLTTSSLLASRNGNNLVFFKEGEEIQVLDSDVGPIGVHRRMRPEIRVWDLREDQVLLVVSDGISSAGRSSGRELGKAGLARILQDCRSGDERGLAGLVLAAAVEADNGKPHDDMSVAVMSVSRDDDRSMTREISVSFSFVPGMRS